MPNKLPLDPVEFSFWTPPADSSLTAGPDQTCIPLPQIPLPLHAAHFAGDQEPTDRMIGEGLYAYLRRFPDCPENFHYARLLQQAFPYYVADLGSQIIMLEAKEVDPPYIRRKISYLKILALLEPDNFGLLQRIGVAYFELAMIYTELIHVRRELGHARLWLKKAWEINCNDLGSLNYLGQICYLVGDYDQAGQHWQQLIALLPSGPARSQLQARVDALAASDRSDPPLIEGLEAIGVAMEHYREREYPEACFIMERLEEDGGLTAALPNSEFFYFLGLCRVKTEDPAGAFEAFSKALEINPQNAGAEQELQRILDGGDER